MSKLNTDLIKYSGDIRKSSEGFVRSSEVFGERVIVFDHLRNTLDDRWQSSSVIVLTSKVFVATWQWTGATLFALVLHFNCTGPSQSESSIYQIFELWQKIFFIEDLNTTKAIVKG